MSHNTDSHQSRSNPGESFQNNTSNQDPRSPVGPNQGNFGQEDRYREEDYGQDDDFRSYERDQDYDASQNEYESEGEQEHFQEKT
jgi:hypothetical protein